MVLKQWINKFSEILKKYRYALIILLIGLVLMAVPGISNNNDVITNDSVDGNTSSLQSLEQKLSSLLSKVEGAGDVEVILTIAAGEEIIYQTNVDEGDSDTSTSKNINTVTVTDSDRNETGLIKQVKTEIYQGAIIVCGGADDPSVRFAIVDAVSRITGLGTNSISVLKMK